MRKAVFLLILLIINSCKNDDTELQVAGIQDSIWHPYAAFQSEFILNTYTDENIFVLAGQQKVSSLAVQDSTFKSVLDVFPKSFNAKPTSNQELVLYKNQVENWELIFIPTTQKYECDASSSSIFSSAISIASIDSSLLSEKAHLASNSFLDPIGTLTDDNIFYSIIRDDVRYFFLKLKITTNSFFNDVNQLECFEYEIEPIIINQLPEGISGDYKYATLVDSKFYVYFDDYPLVIINDEGNAIDGQLNEGKPIIFEDESKIFAFIPSTGKVYEEEGSGNWSLKKDNLPIFTSEVTGILNIDNSLIFYSGNEIFNLDIDSLELLEIVNKGIANSNRITSISKFNNRIWVSTAEGLFFKERGNFYQYK